MVEKLIEKEELVVFENKEKKVDTDKFKSVNQIEFKIVDQRGTRTVKVPEGTTMDEYLKELKLGSGYRVKRGSGADSDQAIRDGETIVVVPKIKGGL